MMIRSHHEVHHAVAVKCGVRGLQIRNGGREASVATYLGSEDGGSSTHKRGSISRKRSEEGGYEEPWECSGNVVVGRWVNRQWS
jgi:hypothetical protein